MYPAGSGDGSNLQPETYESKSDFEILMALSPNFMAGRSPLPIALIIVLAETPIIFAADLGQSHSHSISFGSE